MIFYRERKKEEKRPEKRKKWKIERREKQVLLY
jgi:hypothetical protein